MTTLRLGTRKSPLALAQSRAVAAAIEAASDGRLTIELIAIETSGDVLAGDLAPLGGKGLFTLELETGLLKGDLDLAVHSLKDLPGTLPAGLCVAAHPERADPRDVLISDLATRIVDLPRGARVLTGALRRRAQLLALRPDLVVESIRGNVGTRLRKWRESGAEAIVLAAAGLKRLAINDSDLPLHPLDPAEMLPAPGQGTLAIETHSQSAARSWVAPLDHEATAIATLAERAVVAAFGGNCALPLAAWARIEHDELLLDALLATPDGSHVARASVRVSRDDDPRSLAASCVEQLEAAGAREILARISA